MRRIGLVECFAAVQLSESVRVSVCRVLAFWRSYALRHLLPLFLPTRLETRTKESNLYASDRVSSKLGREMNVKVLV